jgi:hypothetical protein
MAALTTINQFEASSISEYLARVVDNASQWTAAWKAASKETNPHLEIWYRGHERSSWKLLPGAYRDKRDATSAFHRFTAMAAPYMDRVPQTQWEWYFAAQHYGVATRLLDWTEDALTALHFAMTAEIDPTKLDSSDPPCVWVVEAAALNQILHEQDTIYVVGGAELDAWTPDGIEQIAAKSKKQQEEAPAFRPVAVLPPWTTSRIFRQRGRFTIHGAARLPIEDYFLGSDLKVYSSFISKISISDVEKVASELRLLGFAKHHLYPEAANLGEHLMRMADSDC